MRVLCTSIPAHSHMLRTLEAAKAIRSLGHEVTFAAAQKFAARIRAAGITHVAAGLEEVPVVDMTDPDEYARLFQGQVYPQLALRMYKDLRHVIDTVRPDVVIRDFSERGAALASDRLGIPHVTVNCTSTVIVVKDVPADNWYNRLRSELGLALVRSSAAESPWLSISFQPRGFHGEQAAFPENMIFARYEMPPYAVQGPSAFAETAGGPRVLVTMGTIVAERHPELCAQIVNDLQGSRRQVVVVRSGAESGVRRLSSTVTEVTNAALIPLIRDADVIVNHGGINTVLEGFAHEVPSVVVPVFGDQFYTGRRCVQLEAGLCLDRSRTASELSAAVDRVAEQRTFRTAAAAVGREIATTPDLRTLLSEHSLFAGQEPSR